MYVRLITAASKGEYSRQMLARLEVRARKIVSARAGVSVRDCVWVGYRDGAPRGRAGKTGGNDLMLIALFCYGGLRRVRHLEKAGERSARGIAHSSHKC